MNKTSSIVTGGVTMSAATLVPLVQWAMNGLPKPIPDGIPLLVAAGLITGAHALYNIYAARAAAKAIPASPAVPAASVASSIVQS
jgi:hypothetical protein